MSGDPVIHKKRQSLLESHERLWRVTDRALDIIDADVRPVRIDFRDIKSLCFAYAPTQLKLWRYVAEITLRNGRNLSIDNGHFHGIGDFEERSDSFRHMLEALFAALKQHNPEARLITGERPGRHWGYSVLISLALFLMAWVTWAVSGHNLLICLTIFGGVFLVYASGAGDLMRQTRPGQPQTIADISALPEAHLPPAF
jgi:hypothetical protein